MIDPIWAYQGVIFLIKKPSGVWTKTQIFLEKKFSAKKLTISKIDSDKTSIFKNCYLTPKIYCFEIEKKYF